MHGADAHRHTALGQLRPDLGQGDVTLLGKQLLDEVPVRLDPALVPVTTARLGDRPAMLKCKAPPANSARDADIKMGRSRSATHAAVDRSDNPVPQVLRKRPCHPCWPPASSKKDGSEPRPKGNPLRVRTWGKRSNHQKSSKFTHHVL